MDDPDEAVRRDLLEEIYSLAVDAAAARGFLTFDERGVAILIPPGRQLYDKGTGVREHDLISNAFQQPRALLEDYRRRIHAAYPVDAGSWYLRYLVVPAAKCRRAWVGR